MSETTDPFSAIKERLERATPGPWYLFHGGNEWAIARDAGGRENIARVHIHVNGDYNEEFLDDANAEFIAAAPSDIRTLLEAVEERDAEIARLRAMADKWIESDPAPSDIDLDAMWERELYAQRVACAKELLAALKGSDSSEASR